MGKRKSSRFISSCYSIAGIITTIVIRTRKVIKQGSKAVNSLAKAIANIGKKLGLLIAPILNLIAQMLTWGAKGIEFLAKNLWLLAIMIAYFVYDRRGFSVGQTGQLLHVCF